MLLSANFDVLPMKRNDIPFLFHKRAKNAMNTELKIASLYSSAS